MRLAIPDQKPMERENSNGCQSEKNTCANGPQQIGRIRERNFRNYIMCMLHSPRMTNHAGHGSRKKARQDSFIAHTSHHNDFQTKNAPASGVPNTEAKPALIPIATIRRWSLRRIRNRRENWSAYSSSQSVHRFRSLSKQNHPTKS